jgi:hypothetical protein
MRLLLFVLLLVAAAGAEFNQTTFRGRAVNQPPTPASAKRTAAVTPIRIEYTFTIRIKLERLAIEFLDKAIDREAAKVTTANFTDCGLVSATTVRQRTLLIIGCTANAPLGTTGSRDQAFRSMILRVLKTLTGVASTHVSNSDFHLEPNKLVALNLPKSVEKLRGPPKMPRPAVRVHKRQTAQTFVESNAPSHLDRLDQPTPQLDALYRFQSWAEGVTIYILDTGVDITHPEFTGRASRLANTIDGNPLDCNGALIYVYHY